MNVAVVALLVVASIVAVLWLLRRSFTAADVMTAYAKDAVDAAEKRGVELDYSEQSIGLVEQIAAHQHSEIGSAPSDKTIDTFAKIWGAYVGEVMRRHHGGTWSTPDSGPFQGQYVLTIGSAQTSPVAKAYNRLTNGDEDNLDIYYKVITTRPRE